VERRKGDDTVDDLQPKHRVGAVIKFLEMRHKAVGQIGQNLRRSPIDEAGRGDEHCHCTDCQKATDENEGATPRLDAVFHQREYDQAGEAKLDGEIVDRRQDWKQSVAMAGYVFRLQGIAPSKGPNFEAQRATVLVSRDGAVIEDIYPGERIFPGFEDQPTSIVSITDHGLTDLYVFLAGFDGTSSATIRVFINPLVPLVWLGGLLMLLGGIFCWWPLRRVSPGRLSETKLPQKNVEVAV